MWFRISHWHRGRQGIHYSCDKRPHEAHCASLAQRIRSGVDGNLSYRFLCHNTWIYMQHSSNTAGAPYIYIIEQPHFETCKISCYHLRNKMLNRSAKDILYIYHRLPSVPPCLFRQQSCLILTVHQKTYSWILSTLFPTVTFHLIYAKWIIFEN